MAEFIIAQLKVFVWALAAGFISAFLFDFLRVKRKYIKNYKLLTILEDLFYWVLIAVIMFYALYYGNNGQVRGYFFLGVFIGVLLYILVLMNPIHKLAAETAKVAHIMGNIYKNIRKYFLKFNKKKTVEK